MVKFALMYVRQVLMFNIRSEVRKWGGDVRYYVERGRVRAIPIETGEVSAEKETKDRRPRSRPGRCGDVGA